ncbi:hypothetical protein SAMN05216390_10787 [Lachnospiraceae bacterium KH1T2]|nr:hypothetical protein SAMN05216390_10787 [Lachnospiraceae bacterium KH1T2]
MEENRKSIRADIMKREESKKPEWKKKKPVFDGYFAAETFTLIALAVIILVTVICTFLHVQMHTMSALALVITLVIEIAMGILLGNSPSWVALLIVAAIMIAGAATGMFSEVVTGSLVFLGTFITIKEKNSEY